MIMIMVVSLITFNCKCETPNHVRPALILVNEIPTIIRKKRLVADCFCLYGCFLLWIKNR